VKRDLTNPSREGCRFIRDILTIYAKDFINDNDYERMEREVLDVIRGERRIALKLGRRITNA